MTALPKPEVIITHESDLDGFLSGLLLQRLAKHLFGAEVRLETSPGDFVFVPPHAPHREENPATDEEAVVVIARSTQEAVVVNLDRGSGT